MERQKEKFEEIRDKRGEGGRGLGNLPHPLRAKSVVDQLVPRGRGGAAYHAAYKKIRAPRPKPASLLVLIAKCEMRTENW